MPNHRVNASVGPVTPLACASGAPVRPARYAVRYMDILDRQASQEREC